MTGYPVPPAAVGASMAEATYAVGRERWLELAAERHALMLGALDESWWHVRRRARRLARLHAVELDLGLRRPDW